jgi:hypothetical protein
MKNISEQIELLNKLDDAPLSEINLLKNKINLLINGILESLNKWESLDNDSLVSFVWYILADKWWERWKKVSENSKWILLEHSSYWKFATWVVDEKWNLILDERGIPTNFTLLLKNWWNLLRLNSWDIRFTRKFSKN